MNRRMLFAAVPVVALLLVPPAAGAFTTARVEQVEGQPVVVVAGDETGETIDVKRGIDGSTHFLAVQSSSEVAAGNGCEPTPNTEIVGCEGDFVAVVAFGNGGNDTITLDLVEDGLDPLQGEAYGDEGNDTVKAPRDNRPVPQPEAYLEGGNGNDQLEAGNGPDTLLGGGGNDTLQGWGGPDTVRGEDGDDSVDGGGAGAGDVIDGGNGFDSIPDAGGDFSRMFTGATFTVSLNGLADDGEAGEGDNVTGVDKIVARGANVTLIGDNGPNDLFAEAGAATLRGLGGNDRLVTYDGNDTLEGGDGDDFLEAGFGNDVLDGGAGVDSFNGDRTETNPVFAVGNDDIRARDGNAEQIGCGIGSGDRAQVDANDIVGADCESVDRLVVPPKVDPVPGAPKLSGKRTIRAIVAKGLTVTVDCPLACTVTGELRVDKKTARKLKLGGSRVLARGKKSIAGAGKAKVVLKVVRKARKRFRKMKRAKVTLVTRTAMAGKTTKASRKLTLKR